MDVSEEQVSADPRVRRLRKVVAVLALLLAFGGSMLWWQRDALWMGWWDWRATHAASALEVDDLQNCEPRWWTVRRALEQDLDAGCDVVALAAGMGAHIVDHPRRERWVRLRLDHPSARTRARALLTLVAAEAELPLDVSARVGALLQAPEHRPAIVNALERGELALSRGIPRWSLSCCSGESRPT